MEMIILIVGVGFVLILFVIGLVFEVREQRSLVEDRLSRFIDDGLTDAERTSATPMTDWLTTQTTRTSWGQKVARDLARADIKLKAGEYFALMIICAFGVGALAWYFGGRDMPPAIIGAIFGTFIPGFYVRREKGKRLIHFDEQLPDMLNLMVNGLRAGFSNMQAMEAVSKEMPSPISVEFRRVVQEMQLGVPTEKALENLTRRIPSKDLDLVVTAMNVQREVGGNLAEILDTISHTIRERIRVRGEIRVLVTQVMMSGKFLAVMPVLLSVGMYFLNRNYMMNFFNPDTRWLGIPLLIVGAVMIVIGYFVMTKIADIEI